MEWYDRVVDEVVICWLVEHRKRRHNLEMLVVAKDFEFLMRIRKPFEICDLQDARSSINS